MLFGKKFQDSREPNARLADGDRVLAPGQTESLTAMVERGRMVRVPLGRIEETR
jgi:hypothetical protein